MYKKILIATDGSTLSGKAVKSGILLAASLHADLVALYVVPRYPVSYFEGSAAISRKQIASTEKSWTEKGQAVVDSVMTAANAEGVSAEAVVVKSDLVADAILAVGKKHKCDLIVMASHGRNGLKRVLLGSETQHVLTHSKMPVLILR
jgi:nucleotide-binding universal stress UspA family protein